MLVLTIIRHAGMGKGTFIGSGASNMKHGVSRGNPSNTIPGKIITFGPFKVNWSRNTNGLGWLYYSRFPHEKPTPDDVRMCITNMTDISKVDATDPIEFQFLS